MIFALTIKPGPLGLVQHVCVFAVSLVWGLPAGFLEDLKMAVLA